MYLLGKKIRKKERKFVFIFAIIHTIISVLNAKYNIVVELHH